MVFWRRRRQKLQGIKEFTRLGETREQRERTTKRVFENLKKKIPRVSLTENGQINFITNLCSAYSARKALQFAMFNLGVRKHSARKVVRKLILEEVSPDYAPGKAPHPAKTMVNEELGKIFRDPKKIERFWEVFDSYYTEYYRHFRLHIAMEFR